jgi:acetyltransferase-like isoleucine patch superfamily enzyme
LIHESAYVEDGAEIGENTNIWHFAHVRKQAHIGKNCNIGKDVYIDINVKIGNNCKIQNFASLYHELSIGDDVFIGPHVCFTNDVFPRAKVWGEEKVAKTVVENGVSIGANATIIAGISLGKHAMIGAGAVVTHDVMPHGLVYGNPARLRGFVCECCMKMQKKTEGNNKVEFVCPSCGKKIFVDKKMCEEVGL